MVNQTPTASSTYPLNVPTAGPVNGLILPRTLSAITGGGGAHYIYAAPPWPLGNTAGRLPGVGQKVPGIDLRAAGGYFIAPPSVHPETQLEYEFLPANWAAEPAPCPAWLKERETPPPGLQGRATPRRRGTRTDQMSLEYALTALREEAHAIASSPPGRRNDTLNKAAFSLGQLVAAGSIRRLNVEQMLLLASRNCGLTDEEARRTIQSGLDSGETKLRRLSQ